MTEGRLSKKQLADAIAREGEDFTKYYQWLEKHMPPQFFEELDQQYLMVIVHNLMGLHLQDFFSQIFVQNAAFVLCLDSPDADLKILKHYNLYGIRNYQTYVSDEPPDFLKTKSKLRIGAIYFSELTGTHPSCDALIPREEQDEIYQAVLEKNPSLSREEFHDLVCGMNSRFLKSLTKERLIMALSMYFRAKTRDYCQYDVKYNDNWETSKKPLPSLQIVFAWRNTPKHRFLYRLAKTIFRHGLDITRINATYVHPYSQHSIIIMSIGLHGIHGKAAWEEADIQDFLQELVTLKYFDYVDKIESLFIDPGQLRGNIGNYIRAMIDFVHQVLVHADPYLYSLANIEEAFCRHPELTIRLCSAFEQKFHPNHHDHTAYKQTREELLDLVDKLDTGNQLNDTRRKNVLKQGMNFIEHCLKTNFYRNNKSALSFRLDPRYLDNIPYDRKEKFPELPFAIFFIKGMHFIGFHIRFKDLSRGGLRTVLPQRFEQMVADRNNVFSECYNLSFTQQKKNKDIPEGGSKAIILLEPYERLHSESDIYKRELLARHVPDDEIKEKVSQFKKDQKLEYLYQTQRAFIHSLVTIVNCLDDGTLKAKHVIDYWKKPEYIYLGPDENMHNPLIEWISEYSKTCGYKPGIAFISSKPGAGINHKDYGITSLGVNVYMVEMLKYLGINPEKDPFTIKISGGPDGDVAGNQILNLHKYFKKTAKLLALIDVSGTIYDPEGLDLDELARLFDEVKPIRDYPPEKLNDGGFLLDLFSKREASAYAQETLCYRKEKNSVTKDWLNGSEMNHLLRTNVHQTKTDIFVPAGGRPRTLNEYNYEDFLDETGTPTSRAIVEGANLYLTPAARRELEKLGVLIIKDSSANKGGVICSSFEVLAGLTMPKADFIEHKQALMDEVLAIIARMALDEATTLLRTHRETGEYLTALSELVSKQINTYTYQILEHLEHINLSSDPNDPLIKCLLNYCPPFITKNYQENILNDIPDMHKKAIIACHIASKLVYTKGVNWSPCIVDILPLIISDSSIVQPTLEDRDIKPLD